jgi:predicted small secreted protein
MKNQVKKISKRTDKFLEAERLHFGHWVFLFVIGLIVAINLGGCNTIAGFGQDIQAVASGTQEYLTNDSSDNVNHRDDS